MRQEFGKWFLDVAKYILTALFLSSYFGKMDSVLYASLAFCIFSFCIIAGIILLKKKERDYDIIDNRRTDGRVRTGGGSHRNKKRWKKAGADERVTSKDNSSTTTK